MYDISEQYPNEIVTYHFLIIPSDLIFDKCYPFPRKTAIPLCYTCPGYC